MMAIFSLLAVVSALAFIAQSRMYLSLYEHMGKRDHHDSQKLHSLVKEVTGLNRLRLTSAGMCCLFYGLTMLGVLYSGPFIAVFVASAAILAAACYSGYCQYRKDRALIALEIRLRAGKGSTASKHDCCQPRPTHCGSNPGETAGKDDCSGDQPKS